MISSILLKLQRTIFKNISCADITQIESLSSECDDFLRDSERNIYPADFRAITGPSRGLLSGDQYFIDSES